MLKTAPEPVDVQDLQFKSFCRLKIFNNPDNSNFSRNCNLVTAASRFGLIFVGSNIGEIQAIQLKDIENLKIDGDKSDYPRRTLILSAPPIHLSVNCEHTILAVVLHNNNCPCAIFYDVKSFYQQEIVKLAEVRLSPTPTVHVTEIGWNPVLAPVFTACKSDGSLGIYELKNPGVDINELPSAAGAVCFCWSPKGKQIAVGSRDGKITQLKPDLKAVKVINAPPLKEPHSLHSLQWISNYQFIGAFQSLNPEGQAVFIVIDAPKTGDPTYLNYDDICYSNGNFRPAQYYMILVPTWNILMAASSNSMEVGILGNAGESWTQWIMGDAARAELPLGANREDTLPVGCALDTGSTQPLPWGESTLPPAPILLLLSHHGVLCCFHVVNLKSGIPTVCSPPDPIKDAGGLQHFRIGTPSKNVPITTKSQISTKLPSMVPVKATTPLNIPVAPLTMTQAQSNQVLNLAKPPMNLFGGQATLTPIVQNKTNQPPVSTQYPSIFQSLSSEATKTVVPSPVVSVAPLTSGLPVSKPVTATDPSVNVNKMTQPESKPDIKTEVVGTDLKAEEEAEKIFGQLVREECLFLEAEVKATLYQGKTLKMNLGSDEVKIKIVENTKLLDDFFKEVVESCVAQNAEVHILKQNVLQSWAWYEEAKSRHLASNDESRMILLRAQPLDSASEKQLATIQHTNYYLESQIAQAHNALDEQWEAFQDYCRKTHKIQIPTMEVIFQTMVKQNAILKKQSYILKDIANRIKVKSRSAVGPSLLRSVDDMKNLPDELKRLRLNPEDIFQIQCEHAKNKMKNFTPKKVQNLRALLKNKEYTRISVIKPQLSSSVIQTSPASKLKQYSFMSPKATLPPKKLDFAQSTPKPAKSEVVMPSSTPIEGLQNFALKFDTKHFSNVPEKSFAPLKSGIASSPNSAFVSTAFGSNTSKTTSGPVFGTTVAPTSSMASFSFNTSTGLNVFGAGQKSEPRVNLLPVNFSSKAPVTTVITSKDAKPVVTGVLSINLGLSTTTADSPKVPSSQLPFSLANILKSTPQIVTTSPSVFTSTQTTTSSSLLGSLSVATSVQRPTSTSITPVAGFGPSISLTPITSTVTSVAVTSTVITTSSFTFTTSAATTSPIFGTPTTKNTIFGTSVTTAAATPKFSFSDVTSNKPVESNNTSIFGATGSGLSTTPSSIFGVTTVASSTATTQPSVFTSSGSESVNSSQVLNATVSKPIFGTATTTQSSIFNAPTTTLGAPVISSPQTTQPSVPAVTTTSVTSQPSIFGVAAILGTKSSATAPTQTTQPTNFSAKTASIFASSVAPSTQTAQSSIFGAATTSIPSVFGTTSITQTTQSSIFAASSPSVFPSTAAATTQPPIFGTTTTSAFGSSLAPTTQTSLFGITTTSAFGTTTASTTQTTQASIFAITTSSAFGSTTTQTSVFGGAPSTSSIFGNVTTATTQSPVFDTTVSTSNTSLFGGVPQKVNDTPAFTSLFGNAANTATTQSVFGTPATTTTQSQFGLFGDAAPKSLFGNPPTVSTQQSVFGNSNQTSVFGGGTTTTPNSVFGQNQTTSAFGQSAFGTASSTFGGPSVFGGSSPTFGQSGGSIFGSAPPTTSTSIFGGGGTSPTGNAFSSGGSVFGTPSSTQQSPFGSSGIFAQTTQQSTFSSNPTTASFGFGGLSVGSTATTSSSTFGTTPAPNPFGGESKSVFGSSATSSSNPVFGGNTGSLFGSPSQTFGTSSFGNQSSPFGQQSTFGQSSFGTFGQAASGPFSGGGGTVNQSGFGTNPNYQKPGGFGSSPVFGGSPAFGSAPSFGATPSFGSSPTFGGSPKVFGATGGDFGAATTSQNAGFGSLANQPTVGFGNLAQQAANTSSSGFSGNSSFSSWR